MSSLDSPVAKGKEGKSLTTKQETWVRFLGWEDPLEKRMATPLQYSCLEKSHGQRSLAGYSPRGRKRVGEDLATEQQLNTS